MRRGRAKGSRKEREKRKKRELRVKVDQKFILRILRRVRDL